jgi:hypothetical protein
LSSDPGDQATELCHPQSLVGADVAETMLLPVVCGVCCCEMAVLLLLSTTHLFSWAISLLDAASDRSS